MAAAGEEAAGACGGGGEEARYASSASLARMLYGADLDERVRRRHPAARVELQSGRPVALPSPLAADARRVTVVRAPMGSGKTTALLRWLGEALGAAADASVLVISCRRSFTRTLHERLREAGLPPFATYLAARNYVMTGAAYRRLLVQVESLHRVDEALLGDYDILVLDEIMSTLAQLYSPTMGRLHRVDALLHRLLRRCPRIVAMDATANAQLVDLLAALRGAESLHVVICDHAAAGFARRRCVVARRLGARALAARLGGGAEGEAEAADEDDDGEGEAASFFARLRARLEAGCNVCLFSSTVLFSELAARFCLTFTPSVLVLNSTRPAEDDVARWRDVRVLIYTTVITVGLSFDHSYFHAMFAYVKPMAHGPDMVSVYQSLGRIRSLVDNELCVYLDSSAARAAPVFTPMLLNHVVAARGGWPAAFSEVTNLLCCCFRAACAPAFRDARGLALFPRFKYKHLFERCTLASASDSLNILHALLENNRVEFRLAGCAELTAAGFCRFLADIRADAAAAAAELRALAARLPPPVPAEGLAEHPAVAAFAEKYLRAGVPPAALEELLRALAAPAARASFVNLAVLGGCLRVPAAAESQEVFANIYRHYAAGELPVVAAETGAVETVALAPGLALEAHWRLFGGCAAMARAMGLLSGAPPRGGARGAEEPEAAHGLTEAAIAELLGPPERRDYAQWMLEIARCNIAPAGVLARAPVARVAARLSGRGAARGRAGGLGAAAHAVGVFKVVWEEVFGARLQRSTQTFPGSSRVKNLRKHEIVALLDAAGVARGERGGTHRELYRLLMSHKARFASPKYSLRLPRWSRLLGLAARAPGPEASLDAALALVPALHWPLAAGALDFCAL
ncbi:DNA replication origin-binding helicase [Cervid alphaherpesvirus 2]|uniref:Replication origin-binding protein n=1 Tax=Cervid alphaherpesvirus 2 TaxID=365327 RepID=A0A455JIZ7_9ALPH|nr:DNA replication origin-binding helicase [Cervid alphaherpesvirus 2]AVT50771.1 DNA replication origin-binding helicase [Cervid alphaherpesvirus 2]